MDVLDFRKDRPKKEHVDMARPSSFLFFGEIQQRPLYFLTSARFVAGLISAFSHLNKDQETLAARTINDNPDDAVQRIHNSDGQRLT